MTSAELADYEEKKIKMKKAMGESVHVEGAPAGGEPESMEQRRLNLIKVGGRGIGGHAIMCREVLTSFDKGLLHRGPGFGVRWH